MTLKKLLTLAVKQTVSMSYLNAELNKHLIKKSGVTVIS